MVLSKNIYWFNILLLSISYLAVTATSKNLQSNFLRVKMQCQWKAYSSSKNHLLLQQPIANYLSHNQGYGFMMFYDNSTIDSAEEVIVTTLLIRLFDPKYVDGQIIQFFLPLNGSYNNKTNQWSRGDVLVKYQKLNGLKVINQQAIRANFKINQNFMRLSFINSNMQIIMSFQPKNQSFILPLTFIVLNIFLHYLCSKTIKVNALKGKISLLTLYHTAVFMMFLAICELLLGIDHIPGYYSLFIVSGILTAALALRLIHAFQDSVHRIVGLHGYIAFYIILFGYLWSLLNYGTSDWLILLNTCNLVPQIIHNIRNCNRIGVYFPYLFIIVSNNVYSLYLKGCSSNIFRYEPKLTISLLILFLIAIQIGFINLQNKLGNLFFIPKKLIPGYYNYFIKINKQEANHHDQCPICLFSITQNPQNIYHDCATQKVLHNTQDQKKQQSIIIMRTPCGHSFHKKCLEEWMQHQRRCPIDRNYLPPIL